VMFACFWLENLTLTHMYIKDIEEEDKDGEEEEEEGDEVI
jgi:hypothetical protein